MSNPITVAPELDLLGKEVGRLFFNFLIFLYKQGDLDLIKQIELMFLTGSSTLYVNFENVIQFSDELSDIIEEQFVRVNVFIGESIAEFLKKIFEKTLLANSYDPGKFRIGFFNFPNLSPLKSLGCSSIGKLTSISGMITRLSDPHLELTQGVFECINDSCKLKIEKIDQDFFFQPPGFCSGCGNSDSWNLVIEKSSFSEIQKIRIQEIPEVNGKKDPPRTLDVFIKEEYIGVLKLGSQCIFTGLLSVVPAGEFFSSRKNENFSVFQENFFNFYPNKKSIRKPFFSTKFIAFHVFSLDFISCKRLKNLQEKLKKKKDKIFFSKEEREIIVRIRSEKMLYRFLSIFFLSNFLPENIQLTLLLMLMGGSQKKKKGKNFSFANLSICLVGSPILEKIQFLKKLSGLFPRVFALNGPISQGSDVTAKISKNSENEPFFIEAGALLLADDGICFIDEFDKLKIEDRASIFNAIENQNVSNNEMGLDLTIKTRVSVLASFDPWEKNFKEKGKPISPKKSPTPFLNKFDLVFFLDPNKTKTGFSAFPSDIFSFYKKEANYYSTISKTSILRLYISFARLLNPMIGEENRLFLVNIYAFFRKFPSIDNLESFFVNSKQLESLIKISEATSKLFLSQKVSRTHIKSAAKILSSSLSYSNFETKNFFGKVIREIKDKNDQSDYEKQKNFEKRFQSKIKVSFLQFFKIKNEISRIIKIGNSKSLLGVSFKILIKILQRKISQIFKKKKKKKERKILFLFSIGFLFSQQKLKKIKLKISKQAQSLPKNIINYG